MSFTTSEKNGYTADIEAAIKAGENGADTDYAGPDGLKMCGLCHTPKQAVFALMGKQTVVPIMCECANQKKRDRQEKETREQAAQVAKMHRKAYMTDSYWIGCTFANDDGQRPQITKVLTRYVSLFEQMYDAGTGLWLSGSVGTGKSFFAGCVANALIDLGVDVRLYSTSALVHKVGRFESRDQALEKVRECKLLVLDDIGSQRRSEYANEQLFEIVNTRLLSGRPLIATSNLSLSQFAPKGDLDSERIGDRLKKLCPCEIAITGPSRRSVKSNLVKDSLDMLFAQ